MASGGRRPAESRSTARPAQMVAVPDVLRHADRLTRSVHRRRGAARYRPRTGLLGAYPAAGRVRVRRRIERVPASRRPGSRPPRPTPDAGHRAGPLCRRLVRRRVGHRPGDPAQCPGGAGNGRSVGVSGDPGRDHHRLPGRGQTATARWGCGVQQGRPGWWWACWPAACSPATSGGPQCSSSTCRWPSQRWRPRSSSSRRIRRATGPAGSTWPVLWPRCWR